MKHALSSAYDPANLTWRFLKNFARLKIEIRDRGQMTSWHMLLCNVGERYMASDKSRITNDKWTLERNICAILRNPLEEESDSLRLQIIWHASERVKFFENVTNRSLQNED